MSEEGKGIEEFGRRQFLKRTAAVALGSGLGAIIGTERANEQKENEQTRRVNRSQDSVPENVQPLVNPAPEVEELSINPEFEPFSNVLNRFINTDVDPEFWKGLEGILQKNTQDIYDFIEVYTHPDVNGGVREIGYMYYSVGVKKDTQPDLNVLLLKDMGKVSVNVLIKLDAIKATNGVNQDKPDIKISLEEERIKKANALFNKPELNDLGWDNRSTVDRSATDPKTSISYRQMIFPEEGNLNYIITMPPDESAPKFIIPEKKIPPPKITI